MLGDEFAEAQTLVQLTHQNQAPVGGDPRTLEIDLQGGVEGELKGLVLLLTRWVCTSKRLHPFQTRMNIDANEHRKVHSWNLNRKCGLRKCPSFSAHYRLRTA